MKNRPYTYTQLVKLIQDHKVPYEESYSIVINRDYDSECPRKWSNVGIMYAPNSKYIKNEWESDSTPNENDYYIFPVSTYDHSGVSFTLGTPRDRWDSWCDALLCVPKDQVKDDHEAYQIAENEIDTLNQWNDGNVWGFEIRNQFDEIVDSCYGFYSKKDMDGYIDFAKYGLTQDDLDYAWDIKNWY